VREKVLDLISSISNFITRPLNWGLVLLLGCSSPHHSHEAKLASSQSEEVKKNSKILQDINFGVTNPSSSSFIDKTSDYGLQDLHAVTLNSVDLNFDGKSDLIVLPFYYSRPKFYIFDREGKKFRVWEHDPLPFDFKASYILVFDFNKDKIPDLLSGVLNQRSEISQIPLKFYLGSLDQGKLYFKENPRAFKLPAEPTSSVTILDFDLDGWADIFVSNWFATQSGQYYPVADRLLRNNTKGGFEDVSGILRGETKKNSDQLFPPEAKPTYGASTCDIDQNGFPDILTVSSAGYKNKLWMNLKENITEQRYFEDVGPVSNYASDPDGNLVPTGGGRSFFSACIDYNDDGLMDIFLGELSHGYDNESVDRSSILTGSRTTYPPFFLRTEYISDATSDAWNQGDRRGVWVDHNLDGRPDLLVENSGFPPYSRLVLFEQDSNHAFNNIASKLGIDIVNPTATIVLDINDDGKPDILTSQNNIRRSDIRPRLYLFENNQNLKGKKTIKFHLHGLRSNPQGIGAMVSLYTVEKKNAQNKILQKRWVEYYQGGLPSQNESGIIFGVSENFNAIGVKVNWPYSIKKGSSKLDTLEKLYSLRGFINKDYVELTLCETGQIIPGKKSCPF
jgi:hypothetical protein